VSHQDSSQESSDTHLTCALQSNLSQARFWLGGVQAPLCWLGPVDGQAAVASKLHRAMI